MNRNIQTTAKYIINDYKRVFNDVFIDFLTLTLNNFRAIDLMINDLKLIKNFQTNISFDDDFVKNLSIIVNKIIIVETNISTFSKIIVFKMLVFVISSRLNKSKINQLIVSFVFSIVVASTFNRSSFFNLKK